MLHLRARACRERISDSVGMSQPVRGTRLRGVVRCSKSLPLCPRGPDGKTVSRDVYKAVAPVPASAGRMVPGVNTYRVSCCPCARVGRTWGGLPAPGAATLPLCPRGPDTHGKHWGLTLWKARKCPKVVGGLPMEAGDPRRGLPADTASGQGQAFQVSGPNPGDRSREGACRAEL